MRIDKRALTVAMAKLGFDFVRLSKESGISRTTLSYIYNGKLCKPATAGKLAKALGVPVEELIEERSNR